MEIKATQERWKTIKNGKLSRMENIKFASKSTEKINDRKHQEQEKVITDWYDKLMVYRSLVLQPEFKDSIYISHHVWRRGWWFITPNWNMTPGWRVFTKRASENPSTKSRRRRCNFKDFFRKQPFNPQTFYELSNKSSYFKNTTSRPTTPPQKSILLATNCPS